MAKLRRNHAPRGSAASGKTIAKVGVFGAILAALVYAFQLFSGGGAGAAGEGVTYDGADYYLPTGGRGEIVRHRGFTLSYDEEWEQAEWVAYLLEGDNLRREWTKRNDDFRPDPSVSTASAEDYDYRGSGYDRGHLAPFADFAYDAELAAETFYLSNISPQARQFNQGVWRELEELTRDWAEDNDRLYVVTGPVMTEDPKGSIGRRNRVAVPAAYFKVLLDLEGNDRKAIGFIIPNEVSFDPLTRYAYSVDEVEQIVNLDFFAELMPDDLEASLEADGNIDFWRFDRRKFDKRVGEWNRRAANR